MQQVASNPSRRWRLGVPWLGLLALVGFGCVGDDPRLVDVTPPLETDEPNPEDTDFGAFYTRTSFEDEPRQVSGDYADVVVAFGEGSSLVFSRATSFRPVWVVDGIRYPVEHLATIAGDGPAEANFDRTNRYSYARIVESGPRQIVVHWRYFPDLDRLSPTDVVHEVYTINDTGSVRREHDAGTATIEAWLDPGNTITQTFRLTPTVSSTSRRPWVP
ncbi:MAG: hypothetical protein AAGA48_33140 [Myxococcota bacterium]